MRTLLLVGIAGFAAWHADSAMANQYDSHSAERRIVVINSEVPQDEVVYVSGDDRAMSEADYRGRWQGQWNGQWNGQWVNQDGQVYRGSYDGTYDGVYDAGDRSYRAESGRTSRRERHRSQRERVSHRRSHDDRRQEGYVDRGYVPGGYVDSGYVDSGYGYSSYEGRGYEGRGHNDIDMARRCQTSNGVGGAVVGGVVGGVVGNRVAGRGNRTAGTILGAGAGAIAGAVIENAADRRACDDWLRSQSGYRGAPYPVADGGYYASGDYYQESGYEAQYASGYRPAPGPAPVYAAPAYSQGFVVTSTPTIIIEETETYYDEVTVAAPRTVARRTPARRPAARRAAPRRVVNCTCR